MLYIFYRFHFLFVLHPARKMVSTGAKRIIETPILALNEKYSPTLEGHSNKTPY